MQPSRLTVQPLRKDDVGLMRPIANECVADEKDMLEKSALPRAEKMEAGYPDFKAWLLEILNKSNKVLTQILRLKFRTRSWSCF